MRESGAYRAGLGGAGVKVPLDLSELGGQPLRLDVRCLECESEWTERVERAFVDVKAASDSDSDWDGVLLSKVISCSQCGAIDRYQLAGHSHLVLAAENLRALGGEAARVVCATAATWDGSPVQRASDGIKRLERFIEREPTNGEAWRRLGNYLERFGAPREDVIAAWRRAVEVDDEEVEAAYSLAAAAAKARSWFDFEDALRELLDRLRHSRGQARRHLAVAAACLIREATFSGAPPRALELAWSGGSRGGKQVVYLSSISLAAIPDWEALEDFLADRDLVAGHLTPELPTDRPTLLELELLDVNNVAPRRPGRSRRKAKRKRKLASKSRKRNR